MTGCFYVGIGGAIGAVLRYLIGRIPINSVNGFPFNTLIINILGSFVIGLIVAVSSKHSGISPNIILLLKTGICGGFTTFSTFALESSVLLQNGKAASAVIYITASVAASIAAIILAQLIVR